MNILKTLRHHKWGAQRETIIQIYQALIRSKLDYGCIIFGNAKPSYLKTLEPIQNAAIRLATGAFRTSPIISIQCESGQIPLRNRRTQLTLAYITNLVSNPTIPSYNNIFQEINNHITIQNYAPIHQKIIQNLNNMNISLQHTEQQRFNKIPPWTLQQPKYNTNLSRYTKQDTSPQIFKKRFNEIMSKYDDHIHIYTDGSKIDHKTGAAILIGQEIFKFHLPAITSVFTAEVYSVLQSSIYISKNSETNKKFVIITDSLSTIESMKQMYTRNAMIQEIQDTLHQVIEEGIEVIFIWVPSHVGIKGNEKVDKAAKEAILTTPIKVPIPPYDLKNNVKRKIKEEWQTSWFETNNNKLRKIKSDTSQWHMKPNRKDQIIMTRLRIGHTLLTHQYILEKSDPIVCDLCHTSQTVEHIIIDCPKYAMERRKNLIPLTLKEALSDEEDTSNKVLQFLKDILLYDKI